MESHPPIPESQPTRLDPRLERLILHPREASNFGPKRLHYWLKRNLEIVIAISTIAKYLHKHGQTKKHLKRGAAKSFDWKALPLFSVLQVDIKEIMDTNTFTQEEKWLYKRLGLPLYQFTAIFPSLSPGLASTGAGWHALSRTRQGLGMTGQGTRARFISFPFQNTKRASLNFLEYLFSHLESHGAPFEEIIYLSHRDPVRTDRLGSRVWGLSNQGCEAIPPRPQSTQIGENPSLHSPPYQEREAGG